MTAASYDVSLGVEEFNRGKGKRFANCATAINLSTSIREIARESKRSSEGEEIIHLSQDASLEEVLSVSLAACSTMVATYSFYGIARLSARTQIRH